MKNDCSHIHTNINFWYKLCCTFTNMNCHETGFASVSLSALLMKRICYVGNVNTLVVRITTTFYD